MQTKLQQKSPKVNEVDNADFALVAILKKQNPERFKQLVQTYGVDIGPRLLVKEHVDGHPIKELHDLQVGTCADEISSLSIIPPGMELIIKKAQTLLLYCISTAVLIRERWTDIFQFKKILPFMYVNATELTAPPFIKRAPSDFEITLVSIKQYSKSWSFHFSEKLEQFNSDPIALFETFMSYLPKIQYDEISLSNYLLTFIMSQATFFWQQKTFWSSIFQSLEMNENSMTPEKCSTLFLEFESLITSVRNRMILGYLIVPFVKRKHLNDDFLKSVESFLFVHIFDQHGINQGLHQWYLLLDELKSGHPVHYDYLIHLTGYFKELLSFFHDYISKLTPVDSMASFINSGKHNFLYRIYDFLEDTSESVSLANLDFYTTLQGPFIASLGLVSEEIISKSSLDSWVSIRQISIDYAWLFNGFEKLTQSIYSYINGKFETADRTSILKDLRTLNIVRKPSYNFPNFSIPKLATRIINSKPAKRDTKTNESIMVGVPQEEQNLPQQSQKQISSDEIVKGEGAEKMEARNDMTLETANNEVDSGSGKVDDTGEEEMTKRMTQEAIEAAKNYRNDSGKVDDTSEEEMIKRMTQEAIEAAKNYRKSVPKVLSRKQIRDDLFKQNEKVNICKKMPTSKKLVYVSDDEDETFSLPIDQFMSLCNIFYASSEGLQWPKFLKTMQSLNASLVNHYGSVHVFKFANDAKLRVDMPHTPKKGKQALSPWNLRFIRKFLYDVLSLHPFYFKEENNKG